MLRQCFGFSFVCVFLLSSFRDTDKKNKIKPNLKQGGKTGEEDKKYKKENGKIGRKGKEGRKSSERVEVREEIKRGKRIGRKDGGKNKGRNEENQEGGGRRDKRERG